MTHENYAALHSKDRLNDVNSHDLIDTPRERELDELAAIASAICQTPVALVTILDDKKQWFKANIGFAFDETPVEASFCTHTLSAPNDVLVVEDASQDILFQENPLVVNDPHIRFYAGVPLVSSLGNVLGTLCVIDFNPRNINQTQIDGLQLLSKKAMEFIEARGTILQQKKTISGQNAQLDMLCDGVMGTYFEMVKESNGYAVLRRLSKSVQNLHPILDPESIIKDPNLCLELLNEDHRYDVLRSLAYAVEHEINWTCEFCIPAADEGQNWFRLVAQVDEKSKHPHQPTRWHGIIYDITVHKQFELAVEQMTLDIAHVVRKPVTSMLALSELVKKELRDDELSSEYLELMNQVSAELDARTKELTQVYEQKLHDAKRGKNTAQSILS